VQNLSSQQSIVRTDFTLKYYTLDEKLSSDPLLKVQGPDTKLFMRSWLEYAQADGNCIIHWSEGDFAALVKTIGDRFQSDVVSTEKLLALLAEQGAKRKVIFAVDAQKVASAQLSLLLQTLRNSDAPSKADSDTDYHAKLVLYFNLEEMASYQKVLSSSFSQSLHIGAVNPAATARKTSFATVLLSTLLLAFIISGVSYWQILKNSNSDFSLWIASATGWQLDRDTAKPGNAGIATHDNRSGSAALSGSESTKQLASSDLASAGTSTEPVASIKNIEATVTTEGISIATLNVAAQSVETVSPAKKALAPELDTEKIAGLEETSTQLLSQEGKLGNAIAKPAVSSIVTSNDVSDNEVSAVQSVQDAPIKVKQVIASTDIQSQALQQINSTMAGADLVTTEPVLAAKKVSDEEVQITSKTEDSNAPIAQSVAPVAEKDQQLDAQKQLQLLIDAWIAAWQQQNFEKYSTFYGPKFTVSKKLSHKGWLKWRKQRIEKPKWIKLSRSEISFIIAEGDEQLSMTFTLNYESPNYQDETLKRLTLKPVGESYQIILEENMQVSRIR